MSAELVTTELIALDTQRWFSMAAAVVATLAFLVANVPRLMQFNFEELLVRFGILWLLCSIIYGFGETLGFWDTGPVLRILLVFIGCFYIAVAEAVVAIKWFRAAARIRRLKKQS